eukprot:m.41849 g.41849  ORF g.41849 m.41849 type:complete len:264 (+) comp33278_c0_seq1:20-811(+)
MAEVMETTSSNGVERMFLSNLDLPRGSKEIADYPSAIAREKEEFDGVQRYLVSGGEVPTKGAGSQIAKGHEGTHLPDSYFKCSQFTNAFFDVSSDAVVMGIHDLLKKKPIAKNEDFARDLKSLSSQLQTMKREGNRQLKKDNASMPYFGKNDGISAANSSGCAGNKKRAVAGKMIVFYWWNGKNLRCSYTYGAISLSYHLNQRFRSLFAKPALPRDAIKKYLQRMVQHMVKATIAKSLLAEMDTTEEYKCLKDWNLGQLIYSP